jgi:hypothetical protein
MELFDSNGHVLTDEELGNLNKIQVIGLLKKIWNVGKEINEHYCIFLIYFKDSYFYAGEGI